jgi:3-isopropylmalate/(R)-2-methylmalate dehydratase small subunit
MKQHSTADHARRHLVGTAIVVHGDDIDTDRIMPARFLKATSFAGLENHVFADERRAFQNRGEVHPFDDPQHRCARILLVGKNFGCGSSREHAPQGLCRWGIEAVVGESFGEIFAGNCVSVGVPCLRVTADEAERLRDAAEAGGSRLFTIDLEEKTIRSGNLVVPVELPEGARLQFIEGTWDATAVLLGAGAAIEHVASRLPYLTDWGLAVKAGSG